jgi:ATP:corrinoid adenosyltransferase
MGVALVAFVIVVVVWTAALRAMDPRPHRAVLDELQIPVDWELAHEEIVQNVILGSRVER